MDPGDAAKRQGHVASQIRCPDNSAPPNRYSADNLAHSKEITYIGCSLK